MEPQTNLSALNISPFLWWEIIGKAQSIAVHYAKELFDFDFAKFLQEDEIVSQSRVFESDTPFGFTKPPENIKDYNKVAKYNSAKTLIRANTLEELNANTSLPKDNPVLYIYSIKTLHHLAFSFYNLWLIFNSPEYLQKWNGYFGFTYENVDKSKADVYKRYWFHVMLEIDKMEEFERVSHYKSFVRQLHEFEKDTDYIEAEWIKKRDSKKNNAEA